MMRPSAKVIRQAANLAKVQLAARARAGRDRGRLVGDARAAPDGSQTDDGAAPVGGQDEGASLGAGHGPGRA